MVNCARAIEGLKYLVATPGTSRSKAWEEFRNALHLGESYVRLIIENSIDNRHGNRVHISGEITTEVLRRSWTIMNRFFEYMLRGKTLPNDELDLLV